MKFKITRKDQDIIASVMVFKEKWWLWVISTRNLIRYGISTVLGLTLLISYAAFHKPEHQIDYLNAQTAFHEWENGNEEKLTSLEQMLHKHPELHAKYDALIANHLLSIEKGLEAKGYALRTLKRTSAAAPYHTRYAKTSVAISEGKYKEALSESEQLKLDLQSQEGTKVLFGFNLLRIAALQRELGNYEAEQTELKELQQYLADNKKDQELELLAKHFHTGNVGLDDYIAFRKDGH